MPSTQNRMRPSESGPSGIRKKLHLPQPAHTRSHGTHPLSTWPTANYLSQPLMICPRLVSWLHIRVSLEHGSMLCQSQHCTWMMILFVLLWAFVLELPCACLMFAITAGLKLANSAPMVSAAVKVRAITPVMQASTASSRGICLQQESQPTLNPLAYAVLMANVLMVLQSWSCGRVLVWDATCPDTLAPSHIALASRDPGLVAEQAEQQKKIKYADLLTTHHFVPIGIETTGVFDPEALSFFKD